MSSASPTALRVLVVDDERPALDELAWLLERDPRVSTVVTTDNAAEALRVLQEGGVDAVFTDIRMPGLTGLELARVLARFRTPPPVVFVTAHDDHAVDAFELNAADYLLKPVREDRLAEAVRRVVDAGPAADGGDAEDSIAVELGGVTRFVSRADVLYVEAHGDYARLHTADGSHLIRSPLTTLEEEWRDAGFVRIHRSLLVALRHVQEVRMDSGRCSVVVGDQELMVSRRHTRELRDLLVRRARPGGSGRP
jgi:DNA-binding LytR/AlgR family response regulator